jgi:hypothetical protein
MYAIICSWITGVYGTGISIVTTKWRACCTAADINIEVFLASAEVSIITKPIWLDHGTNTKLIYFVTVIPGKRARTHAMKTFPSSRVTGFFAVAEQTIIALRVCSTGKTLVSRLIASSLARGPWWDTRVTDFIADFGTIAEEAIVAGQRGTQRTGVLSLITDLNSIAEKSIIAGKWSSQYALTVFAFFQTITEEAIIADNAKT